MLLAQISDLHVTAAGTRLMDRIDTADYLARAVAHLNALRPAPDFVVITGDLVDQGSPAEYENLRAILAGLALPWSVLPGNHDDRAALRGAFDGTGRLPREGEFLHYVVEELPVRLIALDTQVPGATGGDLCPARLDWLAARLDEARTRWRSTSSPTARSPGSWSRPPATCTPGSRGRGSLPISAISATTGRRRLIEN
jgi:3',5'-cyclic AMP phosphodiesterase CpdA